MSRCDSVDVRNWCFDCFYSLSNMMEKKVSRGGKEKAKEKYYNCQTELRDHLRSVVLNSTKD